MSAPRGLLSDLGAASSSSGTGARDINLLVAQNTAELALILTMDNTQAGQVEAAKLAIRTGNQFIFQAIVKAPSAAEIGVYPVIAKIHTVVKIQLARVVALELLKSAGAHSTAVIAQLTSAFPIAVLIATLKGSLPSLATLAEFYAAYCSAISLGHQAVNCSIESLTSDIGPFSAFITFTISFFAGLGLITTQLSSLVAVATTLSLRLGPMHRAHV